MYLIKFYCKLWL